MVSKQDLKVFSTRKKKYFPKAGHDVARYLYYLKTSGNGTHRSICGFSWRDLNNYISDNRNTKGYTRVAERVAMFRRMLKADKSGRLKGEMENLSSRPYYVRASTNRGLYSVPVTKRGRERLHSEVVVFKNTDRLIDDQINKQAEKFINEQFSEVKNWAVFNKTP